MYTQVSRDVLSRNGRLPGVVKIDFLCRKFSTVLTAFQLAPEEHFSGIFYFSLRHRRTARVIKIWVFPRYARNDLIISWLDENGTTAIVYPFEYQKFQDRSTIVGVIGENIMISLCFEEDKKTILVSCLLTSKSLTACYRAEAVLWNT